MLVVRGTTELAISGDREARGRGGGCFNSGGLHLFVKMLRRGSFFERVACDTESERGGLVVMEILEWTQNLKSVAKNEFEMSTLPIHSGQ